MDEKEKLVDVMYGEEKIRTLKIENRREIKTFD